MKCEKANDKKSFHVSPFTFDLTLAEGLNDKDTDR